MTFPASWYGKVDELPEGRKGTPLAADGSRKYQRQFLVEVTGDGKLMGPIGVCSHPLLPQPWSFYVANAEFDLQALLVEYSAEQRNQDDWSQWVVTATYSSVNNGNFNAPPGGSPGDLPTNPANAYSNPEYEYPEIEWNFEEQQKPVLVDLQNRPYQNTALQPYSPPITFPRGYLVLNITRNELTFNTTKAADYFYATNDAEFLGYPQDFVQCMPPRAVLQFRGRTQFWRVSYKLKFHPRGIFLPKITDPGPPVVVDREFFELNWQPHIQQQGYMQLEDRVDENGKQFGAFGKPVPIKRDGKVITQPVLLDDSGKEATLKDPVSGLVVPFYRKYQQFPQKNFANLITRGFS